MTHLPKIAWISFLAAAFIFPLSPTATAQNAQIRHVSVVKSGGTVQIQIETSKRVVPLTEVVTDPDRVAGASARPCGRAMSSSAAMTGSPNRLMRPVPFARSSCRRASIRPTTA